MFKNTGVQEAVIICLNKQTREAADQSLCVSSRRPPPFLQDCNTHLCPPRYSKTPRISHYGHHHQVALRVVCNSLYTNVKLDFDECNKSEEPVTF